jgi:hypothetical protein
MRTNLAALKALTKECRSVADDRQTTGDASEALEAAASTLEAYGLDLVDLKRLRKYEKLAAKILKSVRVDFSAGGPSDSGAFVSKAMARDLSELVSGVTSAASSN